MLNYLGYSDEIFSEVHFVDDPVSNILCTGNCESSCQVSCSSTCVTCFSGCQSGPKPDPLPTV
jgi:hypothetical protein